MATVAPHPIVALSRVTSSDGGRSPCSDPRR